MDSDMALTELQEHELPEAVVQEDEDDVEELRNSLREVVQDQSVKPKLQCLMADPTFSMVTVQSEDSGIVWETASSRCSTPWASEASYSSDTYSLDGSATGGGGAQGKITIVFDEDKIIRRRKRTRGKARLGERLRRPGSSRSGSALGVERPEMAEVSVPNIRVESVESDTESGEVKDKDQELFSLISEGYEILNIKVPSKLPTVDEEESTELQDNLSYLEETPRIRSKSRRGSEALPAQDYPEMKEGTEGEEVGESKPSEPTEQQGPHSHKDSTSDMDYFEAFTLLDEVVPGQQVPEPVGDETPTKPQREEPNLGQMTATDSLSAAPDDDFVFVTDMDIASERLDEVFYGNKHHAPPEDLMKRGEEDEEEGGKEGRRESLRSLKESGSALFSKEESILTPIFLSPGPPKIIDPILLEEPTAMSFLYSDLYEDAMGERRRSDEEGSEAESVGSDRSFQRRLSDSEETDGYLEKFILKDETPNVEDQSEEADDKGEGLMMWSQSKFELTGFLTRVVEEEEEEKEECKKEEIKDAEMNGYLQPAGYKEIKKSTEMEESTEKSLLHIKETGPDKDSESLNTDSKVTGKRPEKVDVVEEAKSETTPEAHESEVDSQEEVVSDKVSHETELLAQAEEVKKLDEVEVSRVAKPVVIQEPVVVQVNQVTTESKTETVVKASEPVRAEDAIKDPTEAIAGAQELHRVSQKAVTDLSVVIVKVSDDTKMASEIAAEAINRMEMLAEAHKVEKVENRSEEPVSVEEESFTHNPEAEVVPTAPPAEAADRWSSPLAPAEGDKGQEEEPMKKQDLDGEDEWVFTPLRSFAPQEDLSVLHRETVVSEMELHTDAGVTERELHGETAEELEYEIISQQEAREMMVSETERKQLCPGPNSNLERERELEKEKEREMELERERKKQRLKEEERQKREGKERQEKEKQMELERERERERLRLKEAKERQEKERQVEKEREKERQRLKEEKERQARERTIELERERERERQRLKEEKEKERQVKERQARERTIELERERERERQRLKEEKEKERQVKERQERERQMELERERENERQRLKEREEKERQERERQERERQMELERESEKERQRLKEREEKETKERERQMELEREREREMHRLKEEREEKEMKERERQMELEREKEKERQRLKEESEERERQERERERERQMMKEECEKKERQERERQMEKERERDRQRLKEEKERQEKETRERERQIELERERENERQRQKEREEKERQERERQMELERERANERQRLKEEKETKERERQMELEREREMHRLKEERERQMEKERERDRQRLKEEKERQEKETRERERQIELERERENERQRQKEREEKERQERERQMELERERANERQRLKEEKETKERERQMELEREREMHRLKEERERQMEKEREKDRQRLKEEKERQEKERQEREIQIELERERENERQRLKEREEKERQERERQERERQIELERERENERQRLKEREEKERERQMELERERENERQRLKEERERQEKERQEREIQIELERERENERQRLKEREEKEREEKERQERERQERERQIELERERENVRQRLKEREEKERQMELERERENERQRLKEREEKETKERERQMELERERERERERQKLKEESEEKARQEKERQERERQIELEREIENERQRLKDREEKERQERERQMELERERENERQRLKEREEKETKERERQMELERERERERERQKLKEESEDKERQERERQMEREREKDRQRLKEEKERQERERERQMEREREKDRQRLKEEKERQERAEKERHEREEKEREREREREREKEMERLRLNKLKEREEKKRQEREERARQEKDEKERQERERERERENERQIELERERERERLRLKEDKERQEREEKERERERQEEKERHERESQKEEKERRERQEEKERHERERQMELEREIEMKRLKEVEREEKEKEREEREREREMQRLKEVKKTQERERQEREDKEKQMELLREDERQEREEREQKERQEREGKGIQEREKERDNQRLKERQERKSEMELVLEGEKQKERVRENLLMDMERQKEREMEERVREERGLDLPAYEEPIEADYEIFDAEEESQARAAAALQGMDCFCLGCGCLLSETERLSGGHQDHEVTSVETAYEDIKERLSEWISELQERSENIEDLVSELELGYNTVEDHCRDSEEVMEAQNEEMMALVMEQYNTMSLSMEEEKKAKLEQLYDQIVSFQESIDQTKVTLDTTAREAEIDPDTQTSKDIYMRLTEALQSAMSLELGPRGLLVFEDYAKGNAANTHTRRKGIPVPQKPSLQPQECASASSTSVTVYWKVNPGDIIDCFQVYCMEDPQGAVSDEYRVTVKESYCVLEELEPDKVYKVWVMAVNYTGCSLPSERLPFRTAPSVPVIDTGRCTILWDSATLRWNVDNQTPTQSYTLEYCRQYALEGEGLRSISGIQGRQQRVLLHPNENYLFYIKAVNKAGASEQSEAALISTRGTRFHLLKASAHPVLKLSEDQTTLYYPQDTYTERGDVVNECPSVLGELLPMRGHHYWETNVTRSSAYRVGVAYETANRDSLLGENSESWCLHCVPTPYSCRFELLHGSVQSDVFVGEVPSHIGTLLDYKHGRLSFYNTQRGQLLGTLAHCFTQPCHPVLGMEQPGSLKVSMALEVADFAKHS
ncbi:cardiomyopathy-associated protein 5 [Salvelinus fontinalis]|uniref:cardiomyopathy-associated protein 5 n=1 Tax=Salvelinus fontinalis TaxID=8038 RepID=UPI0024868F85|nr:cardiomyopathy-associated protein 5 [Salvelinus fontinalis]